MCDDPDAKLQLVNDLCERLRLESPQQLHTLVRMHLSFELDINTDEYEAVYCAKGKLRKWNRFHKKAKGCASANKTGSPPAEQFLTRENIMQIQQLIDFLMEDENIKQEGIFRKTGSLTRQNDLKMQLSSRKWINLQNNIYNVHDCASVLKNFLSELPEPLLTDAYNAVHGQLAEICNNDDTTTSDTRENRLLRSIQLLVLLLPEDNRILFQKIIEMLYKTAKYECNNKMSADSLSTIFTPHLIVTRNLPPESLHISSQSMSGLVSFMISKGADLFQIPPRLATDVFAYFGKKSTNSLALDESITNTVYTFCDIGKTKAEHDADTTDQALAKLYAHIQTMPESSQKRKYIKQFNKGYGQGTPLQYLLLKRMNTGPKSSGLKNNTKSLGDSIKRHIFNKSLLSRTPKNPSSPLFATNDGGTPGANSLNNSGFNTPVRGLATQPKMRVLFQSPLTIASTNNSLSEHLETFMNGKNSPACSVHHESDRTKINKTKDDDLSDKENNDPPVDYFDNEEIGDFGSDDSGSPLLFSRDKKLKSHYKSEPNLSQIETPRQTTPHVKNFANRLIKGVSMGNLKLAIFSSGNSQSGKQRGFMGKRRKSFHAANNIKEEELHLKKREGDNSAQPEHLIISNEEYWSGDYVMGTPVTNFIGRNSMSPITKSTQRMPKSMQESIMTPRSRKPVMLPGTNLSSSDTNQSAIYKSCSSLNEEDEDVLCDMVSQTPIDTDVQMSMQRAKSLDALNTNQMKNYSDLVGLTKFHKSFSSSNPSLTSEFRDYLFSRSVLTASPADLSFSSQPDDFGDDADDEAADIPYLSEAEMSESLLYCLDGNKPDDLSFQSDENDHLSSNSGSGVSPNSSHNSNMNGSGILINTRKRPSDTMPVDVNDGEEEITEKFLIKKMVLKNKIELDETSL